MVQFRDDGLQGIAKGKKINDALVLIEWAAHLGGHAVGVPVQPLALAAPQRDEVPGGENQVVVGDADVEVGHRRDQGSEAGGQRHFRWGGSCTATPEFATVPGVAVQLPPQQRAPRQEAEMRGPRKGASLTLSAVPPGFYSDSGRHGLPLLIRVVFLLLVVAGIFRGR